MKNRENKGVKVHSLTLQSRFDGEAIKLYQTLNLIFLDLTFNGVPHLC